MRKFILLSTMLVVCGLPATAALAYVPDDGVSVLQFEENPFAYLFERKIDPADDKGPFAYLFERDVTLPAKAASDGSPYSYLFDRDGSDRG